MGILIWLVGLGGIAYLWVTDPRSATAAALTVATFYYAGQFGAMPIGLAAGADPLIVGLYAWAADAAGLLVFFPLTQLGVERLAHRPGLLARWIRTMQVRAHRRRDFILRYGALGLFAFTTLPFLFNSPILGSVIGRIVGIRPARTLFALLSAVSVMSVVWTLVFTRALERAEAVDARLPWVIGVGSATVTALIAAGVAFARWIRRRGDASRA